MSDPRPIGMLDSGIGGLSVLREVQLLLPHESILYVADEGHLPYGPRPRDEIRSFVVAIINFLLAQNCKLIVIPCNTANAAALHYARSIFPTMPIVGMEPAVKPAAEHTRTGVIGVIMTKATFQSELFASVVDRFAKGIRVEAQACPDLVQLAEAGAPDTPESRAIVARYMAPLKEAGIDQLVLGCTHFAFLNHLLQDQLGRDVEIIDPAPAVARQVQRVLEQHQLSNTSSAASNNLAHITYFTSGEPDHMLRLLNLLLGESTADIHAVKWQNGALVRIG